MSRVIPVHSVIRLSVILLGVVPHLAAASTYDDGDIGEYNFHALGAGLWQCSQVGRPDDGSYQALLSVSAESIGFYPADDVLLFEDFKLTSTLFRRNHYVSAQKGKWVAYHDSGNGSTAELTFSYDFGVLTRTRYLEQETEIANYLCQQVPARQIKNGPGKP